jgi:hypothetical protein
MEDLFRSAIIKPVIGLTADDVEVISVVDFVESLQSNKQSRRRLPSSDTLTAAGIIIEYRISFILFDVVKENYSPEEGFDIGEEVEVDITIL